MPVIIFAFSYIAIVSAFSILHLINNRLYWQNYSLRLKRPKPSSAYAFLIQNGSVLVITLMLIGFSNFNSNEILHMRNVTAIGVAFRIVTGALLYLLFSTLCNLAIRWLGLSKIHSSHIFRVFASVWPRDKFEKRIFAFSACMLNPVVEELLFRGVLITALSLVTGNLWIPLIISILLNLSVHLYQSFRTFAVMLIFNICASAILLSGLGLIGSIGFHFLGDLLPLIGIRKKCRQYLNIRRELFRSNSYREEISNTRTI